jgi:uncharacterized SAM-binding protein YcdF (DUF218 family)
MILLLSKIASMLIYPLGLFFLAVLGSAVFRLAGHRRVSLIVLVAAIGMLWIASTPVFAKWMLYSLEAEFPPVSISETPLADVAILLGGTTEPQLPPRQRPDLLRTADRILHAADLYRAGKVRKVIASGGELPWISAGPSEAERMAQLLAELGVPKTAVIIEDKGRTTRENALRVAEIMRQSGFQSALVVTSANHMPRAMAVFRKAGLPVIASSTDVIVAGPIGASVLDWIPDAEALNNTHKAVKEFVGYIVYRLRGWI